MEAFKEEIFIQTSRRGRDRELGQRGHGVAAASHLQGGSGGGRWWNRWSHIHMWWIKTRRDTSRVSHPSPRPDHSAQRSSTKNISLITSGCKISGVWCGGRNCQSLRRVYLKDLHNPRMWTNPPILGFSIRAAARRAPVPYGKWGNFHTPPPHTVPQSNEAGCPSKYLRFSPLHHKKCAKI